jgi:hypothetical protein
MPKIIPLTNEKVAIVDDDDFERLSKYKWYAHKSFQTYYAERKPNNKNKFRQMHHMILGKPKKGFVTDHIDGDGLNNQKINLRHITYRGNCQNRHYLKTSKHPGVSWCKQKNKWRSRMTYDGSEFHLGFFKLEEDAYCTYSISTGFLDLLLSEG